MDNFLRPLLVLVVFTLLLAGCSGSGPGDYDEPNNTITQALPGQVTNVLIDETTIQDWIDEGLVNNDSNFEKVVILDVTDSASYDAGHIPGAQLWNINEQVQNRIEGPAVAYSMVLDGPSMDAMIQKHGIDDRTTIVITTSKSNAMYPSRAYFLFRYWGWPRDKIKVLNGYNGAWSGTLSTTAPEINQSDYSVRSNAAINSDLRVSLDELITAVGRVEGIPLDVRAFASFPPPALSTTGVDPTVSGDYVAFEGRVSGALNYDQANFLNVDMTFKDVDDGVGGGIEADLVAIGIDGSLVVYPYCRSGYLASTAFFVFDGLLAWDAMLYDGSWSQWGQMLTGSIAAFGGQLPNGSVWSTSALTDNIQYNRNPFVGRPSTVLEALHFVDDATLATLAIGANQIENEDTQYMEGSSGGGGVAAPAPGYGG